MLKKKVVIDCGHGGRDVGFYTKKIKEKDINLKIGKKVQALLQKKGIEVCSIRDRDEYVALDERTSRVSQCLGADLLISIHSNASKSSKAQGIETFFYNHEACLSHSSIAQDDIYSIVAQVNKDLTQKSKKLADCLHQELLSVTSVKNPSRVDRGVKQAGAQLLLGVEIPAVLLELGFLTHPVEGKLLHADDSYINHIAWGIYQGVEKYFSTKVA